MARRALTASLVLTPFAVALAMQGCTQDFSTFDPTGSGGGDPTTSTASSPTTTTGTTPNTTTTGPGGGEGGSTTVTSGGGGGSPPTDCEVPADCDDDNPCTDDGCNDGVCANTAVADGPLVENDQDCRTIECAAGVLIDEANDAEDPDDANPPCELTICQDGAPTPDYAAAGTECGEAPQECDGEGLCIGCDPAPPDQDECGAATACAAPDCVDPGVCDPGYLPSSTPVADPTDGDCQKLECTGSSAAPASVADNTDEPADLPCGNRSCSNGAPSTATIAEGMPCLVGDGVCDGAGTAAANCKLCRDTVAAAGTDPGCDAGTPICDESGNGTCRTCIDDVAGAGTDTGCSAGTPVCDETAAGGDGACVDCYDAGDGVTDPGCAAATPACDEGTQTCEECAADDDCGAAEVCDLDTNTCVACVDTGNGTDAGCTDLMPRCNAGACTGCAGNGDCAANPRGDVCRAGNVCGCGNNGDCNHPEAAGGTCNAQNVCQ